jgi:hypothetical protein
VRRRFLLAGVLATLLTTVMAGHASASGPDPDPDPDYPVSTVTGNGPIGTVTLIPGTKWCFDPIHANNSITYHVDILPNMGAPRPRIIIWRWTHADGSDATQVFDERRTGRDAVLATFAQPGFYQACANYKSKWAVAPGNPFDFLWFGVSIPDVH